MYSNLCNCQFNDLDLDGVIYFSYLLFVSHTQGYLVLFPHLDVVAPIGNWILLQIGRVLVTVDLLLFLWKPLHLFLPSSTYLGLTSSTNLGLTTGCRWNYRHMGTFKCRIGICNCYRGVPGRCVTFSSRQLIIYVYDGPNLCFVMLIVHQYTLFDIFFCSRFT